MPAQRKLLPRPCPVCKRKNGTIQLALTYRGIIVRIGHYSSKLRNSVRSLSKLQGIEKEKMEKRMKGAERKWCSFRSDATYVIERSLARGFTSWDDPPYSFSPPTSFIKEVHSYGWQLKDNSGYRYKGRERKNIDYWEKGLKKKTRSKNSS